MRYRFYYRGSGHYGDWGWRETGLETSRRIKDLFARLKDATLKSYREDETLPWGDVIPAHTQSRYYIHEYIRELKEYLYMGDEGIPALEKAIEEQEELGRRKDAMEPYLPKAGEDRDGIAIDGLSCFGQDCLRAYGRNIR